MANPNRNPERVCGMPHLEQCGLVGVPSVEQAAGQAPGGVVVVIPRWYGRVEERLLLLLLLLLMLLL